MRLALLLAAILLVSPPAARGEGAGGAWRPPVPGSVVGTFVLGSDPYAAGQRRGVDLAASAGQRVDAPCSGRVTFAGRLPAGGGARGVSIRCGRLTATVLGLRTTSAKRGARIPRGAPVGAAAGRHIRLGARVTAERFGYVDPLAIHSPVRREVPPPAGPRGSRRGPLRPHGARRAPVSERRAPQRVPVIESPPNPQRAGARASPRRGVPITTWVGLGLLAAGVPAGTLVRLRAERPARAGARRAAARSIAGPG